MQNIAIMDLGIGVRLNVGVSEKNAPTGSPLFNVKTSKITHVIPDT